MIRVNRLVVLLDRSRRLMDRANDAQRYSEARRRNIRHYKLVQAYDAAVIDTYCDCLKVG